MFLKIPNLKPLEVIFRQEQESILVVSIPFDFQEPVEATPTGELLRKIYENPVYDAAWLQTESDEFVYSNVRFIGVDFGCCGDTELLVSMRYENKRLVEIRGL